MLIFHGHQLLITKLCACLPACVTSCVSVSGQATLEMVFDEDLFSQTPPGNFYPLMHGKSCPTAGTLCMLPSDVFTSQPNLSSDLSFLIDGFVPHGCHLVLMCVPECSA